MNKEFIPCEGANGFRVSNPPVLLVACARASLDVFDKVETFRTLKQLLFYYIYYQAGMERLRKKSVLLTGYLESLIMSELKDSVHIFTPSNQEERGCQLSLSLLFNIEAEKVVELLKKEGVICDARKPDVIRVAPAPLYNTFKDVFRFIDALKKIIEVFRTGL
jgi:kynureninase